jgi:hypothetical protein
MAHLLRFDAASLELLNDLLDALSRFPSTRVSTAMSEKKK